MSASVRRFGVREGLPSQEFTERALALDADGVLVAGTGDGSLLLLDTVMADPVRPPPNFVVDALRVRRGEALVDLPLQGGFELRPDDHDLSVVTRLMAFDDPESNRYRFRLRGFDPLYVNGGGVVPIGEALWSKGLPLGTVMAFMMSAIALSIPEAIMLRRVMKPPLLGIFFGAVTVGIIVVGYLFNLLYA